MTAGASVSYVGGASPVTLDAGLTVADAAAASLSAATVSISACFVQGDTLSVGSPQAGITSQYNSATGVLTLSGAAGLAAYQMELDSVTYASDSATTSSRTITWSVNDGVNASSPVSSSVSVSRLPPSVTAGASVSYVAGATPVALDAGLAVTDAAVSLSAATVSISAGFVQGDTLSVGSPQTGITSQYNAGTGVLTLSGAASLVAYQKELDSVTYASDSATTSSRTITWSVNASNPVTSHVSVSSAPPDPSAQAAPVVASVVPQAAPVVQPNNLALSGGVTGADNFIDTLYFVASYADLINAFGTNQQAAQNWYNTREPIEERVETFDGLDYIASYGDLINAFKSAGSEQAMLDAGATHFIDYGYKEGRTTTFNGLDYIASYGDLINAFGANGDAGATHYIEYGHNEGRTTTFDGLDYIASYGDLIKAFGANEQAGAEHFVDYGYKEGRKTTFDGLDYLANYTDLMKAFGANDAGATHYIDYGLSEGRSTTFNVGV